MGPKWVPNPAEDVARKVLDYLVSEHSYGNKESRTGKALEKRFGGIGYGWERDMLRLILALLFRAGSIEVTHQGNRFHNYQDPLSRMPFTNQVAFRLSLFSPRESVRLKTLTLAVEQLEDLTGEEVDVEEGAIASAFKKLANDEMEKLFPLKALVEAHHLPILPLVTDFQRTLSGIQSSSSDDCVRILTETGDLFQETRERIKKIRAQLDDQAIALIQEARAVVYDLGPKLVGHPRFPEVAGHLEPLQTLLSSEDLVDQLGSVATHTKWVADAYRSAYLDLFDQRRKGYHKAIEDLKNRPEWETLSTEAASTLMAPLEARLGDDEDRQGVVEGKTFGKVTLGEMKSDLAAAEALKVSVLTKLQERTIVKKPETVVRRVRISDVFNRPIQSQEDLNVALDQLRDCFKS